MYITNNIVQKIKILSIEIESKNKFFLIKCYSISDFFTHFLE
jgi:hypothetical protein